MRLRVVLLVWGLGAAPAAAVSPDPKDLAIPPQIFSNAFGPGGEPLYDVRVCSLDGEPIRTTKGYSVLAEPSSGFLDAPDTLVIPGTHLAGPRTDAVAGQAERRRSHPPARPGAGRRRWRT